MGLNKRLIIKMSSLILAILALGTIPPFICAAYFHEKLCMAAFGFCTIIYGIIGLTIYRRTKITNRNIRIRDGYMVVIACWLTACLFGALPYYFCGQHLTFIQSIFESTAGFTTTGSSILTEETATNSLILFKAMSIWLGGMGILVLVVSILPNLGIGGQAIANAETPAPRIEKTSTRISDTAKILYIMYISFTVIEFILLAASRDMDIYNSVIVTLSTVSTGGYIQHAAGMMYYDSVYVETIITTFTILAAVNFNLYFYAISRRFKEIFRDTELRVFLGILLISSVAIALNLNAAGIYDNMLTSFRHSLTQVVCFASTSGFQFADFMSWTSFAKTLLFFLMIMGGCAASTAGGIKVVRVIVFFKLISRGIVKRLHPRSIVAVRISGSSLEQKRVTQIATFIMTFIFTIVVSLLIISIEAPDLESALGTCTSILTNTGQVYGTGLQELGYNYFSDPMKLFLSLLMIGGRLELFTVMLLFVPGFWNPNRKKIRSHLTPITSPLSDTSAVQPLSSRRLTRYSFTVSFS